MISRFYSIVVIICLTFMVAADEVVTNEVRLTFSVDDYKGSGVEQNVSMDIALFGEVAPMSVMNFLSLCRGYTKKGTLLHYVGTPVHRIVPDFVIQMGDVTNKDGTGGSSIFGKVFDDEPFILGHNSRGYLAMANSGKNTNGSQFYITLVRSRWLDGHHVVFGKVFQGLDILAEMGEIPSSQKSAYPKKKVMIANCQEIPIDRKWTMTEDQMVSDDDITKY